MDDLTAGLAPVAIDDAPTSDGGQVIADRVQIPTPFIAIATPSMTASCTMAHRASMIELRGLLVQRGVPHVIFDRSRMMYLDRVRDFLCTQFLEDFPDATDLFLVDDDVGFPAEKVLEFAIRPEPLLLGAPPKKEDVEGGITFTVRFLADNSSGQPRLIQNNGLVKIDRGPAGFMRIKRSVLQHLIEADKCVRYREPETGRMLWHFFSCGVAPDPDVADQLTYWGEDTIFIQRVINAGLECWCDPNIHFAHTGLKTWQGNLLRELFRQHGKLIEPEGLAPSSVGASSPVPAQSEAAVMDDYPKWVHGKLAQSAEEESAIEREFLAANPDWQPPAPPAPEGIAPDGVSASTPIVPDDQKSTAELEAEIEASLEHAAELTEQVAGPAAQPVETAPAADAAAPQVGENTPPLLIPAADQTAEAVSGPGAAETLAETPQTAAPAAVEETPAVEPVGPGSNPAENQVEHVEETAPAAAVDTGSDPHAELGAETPAIAAVATAEAPPAESGNSDSPNAEPGPAVSDTEQSAAPAPAAEIPSTGDAAALPDSAAPAAEPAAVEASTEAAPASDSPAAGQPSPAVDQVEAVAPVEQVQPAVEQEAAAGPVGEAEPIAATTPAAEVEPAAAAAPSAAAEASPTVDQPLDAPPASTPNEQEETAAAGDGVEPAAAADQAPADPPADEAPAAEVAPAADTGAAQPAAADAPMPAADAQPLPDSAAPAQGGAA